MEQGLPNITGSINQTSSDGMWYKHQATAEGAISAINQTVSHANTSSGSRTTTMGINFDASLSSSVYGNNENVTPNSILVGFYIKYE